MGSEPDELNYGSSSDIERGADGGGNPHWEVGGSEDGNSEASSTVSEIGSSEPEDEDNLPGLNIMEDGEQEWTVEKVLRKRIINGVLHYRIKWEGWTSRKNTWEPLDHLSKCLEMVEEFEANLGTVKKRTGKIPAHFRDLTPRQSPRRIKTEPDLPENGGGSASGEEEAKSPEPSPSREVFSTPPPASRIVRGGRDVVSIPKKRRRRSATNKNEKSPEESPSSSGTEDAFEKPLIIFGPQTEEVAAAHAAKAVRRRLFWGSQLESAESDAAESHDEDDDGEGEWSPPEEDCDEPLYGPTFRRYWKPGEIPLRILWEEVVNRRHYYLVHLHGRKDIYETSNVTPKNSAIVSVSSFRKWFPQLVIDYYESRFSSVKQETGGTEWQSKLKEEKMDEGEGLSWSPPYGGDAEKLMSSMLKAMGITRLIGEEVDEKAEVEESQRGQEDRRRSE